MGKSKQKDALGCSRKTVTLQKTPGTSQARLETSYLLAHYFHDVSCLQFPRSTWPTNTWIAILASFMLVTYMEASLGSVCLCLWKGVRKRPCHSSRPCRTVTRRTVKHEALIHEAKVKGESGGAMIRPTL